MLAIDDALQVLRSYNINSKKYEPTIYQNANNTGICMDIKDSLFGYLTRIFIFNDKEELDHFLASFFWYKKNNQIYHIKLILDNYQTKFPKIIYQYKDQVITLENMLNMENYLLEEGKEKEEQNEKEFYLKSIHELTNYLINFKQLKENIKLEKNTLKATENDLKFELLTQLTIYYGREKALTKKPITLDKETIIDNTLLLENEKNITTKSLEEIKEYLNTLINIIKTEELDEKNLVNIYSNSVYKYNIDILKKQIEFVKNKINAEKNFNLKGSKLHNIDEELKSFLKTNVAPIKIEIFLNENKTKIEEKFSKITDLKVAVPIITGKNIDQIKKEEPSLIEEDPQKSLIDQFDHLDSKTKSSLILYHSIYKPICNFIIDNHYPDITTIISHFDFNHYYEELENIILDENNNHYLINYFKEINFKSLTDYINSIINICKEIENTNFTLQTPIQVFASNQNTKYKQLSEYPNQNTKYLVKTSNIIFIPEKIEIDWDTNEISKTKEYSYYTNKNIIEEESTITLAKYSKKDTQKDDIIITTDLLLDSEITFKKGHLEGEYYG